jgi:predicted dehydrogenase
MQTHLSRRAFLKSKLGLALAAGAFPMFVPASVHGRTAGRSPNGRVHVAAIGVGPQGQAVMGGLLHVERARVIAVCDVWDRARQEAVQKVNRHYGNRDGVALGDYREVLERADVDAVLIATPDHWHVPVALAAAKSGKDIYLEKPMGLTLAEDKALRTAVQQNARVFQFGTQQRSSREFQRAIELVRNGRVGTLRHIEVWAPASRPGGSTVPAPAPAGLNYDFWLGPAPATPYTDGKAGDNPATGAWKTWWFNDSYAPGFIAGWGVHPLDIALWGHPAMMRGVIEVKGDGIVPGSGACNTAVAWDVHFTFHDGVTLRFRGTPNDFHERLAMNDFSDVMAKYGTLQDHGTAFEGSEGWVEVHRGGLRSHPHELAEQAVTQGDFRARPTDHHQKDWIESILERRPAVCAIEDAVHADLLCHLSDIAVRLPRTLRFDPRLEQFQGDSEANARLAPRAARGAWAGS